MRIKQVVSLDNSEVAWDLSTPTDNFVCLVGEEQIIVHNSPALVAGHHPETGRFFVASKSAFNKTPKINYTHEDIEKNHGHAPGLMEKLHAALDHLPKIMPARGV